MQNKETLHNIINKIFFSHRIFKCLCVLCLFIGTGLFIWQCATYKNPYKYYPLDTQYDNFIEFVDQNLGYEVATLAVPSGIYPPKRPWGILAKDIKTLTTDQQIKDYLAENGTSYTDITFFLENRDGTPTDTEVAKMVELEKTGEWEKLVDNYFYKDFSMNSFTYAEHLYEEAFILQAIDKKIIKLPSRHSVNNYAIKIAALAYSCVPQKLNDLRDLTGFNKYKRYIGSLDNFYIDCEKAKTVALKPESFYFLRHIAWMLIIIDFVCVPTILLCLLILVRFMIISPILWAITKEPVKKH